MKLKEKIHNYLQDKALNKAILKTIGDIGEYFIDEYELKVLIKNDKLETIDYLDFNFPCWDEIENIAKKYYKKFNRPDAKKVKYYFQFLQQEKDLTVDAKNSDIYLGNNYFSNIKIIDADNVQIFGDPIEDGGINITAKNIEIAKMGGLVKEDMNLVSEFVELNNVSSVFTKNINIKSKFIELKKVNIMSSKNIYLKADLIIGENSKIKSINKIVIDDTNCDEIKEVDAPTIIYNGQDITYSEGIVMPKLRNNLIDVLRKTRNRVYDTVVVKVSEETQKYKQNLENSLNSKPITKVLKK